MGLQKSKYPDFNEVIGMASKLFKDMQKSVCEITEDYKAKRKAAAFEEAAENAAKTAAAAANLKPEEVVSAEVKVDVKAEKPQTPVTPEPTTDVKEEKPVIVEPVIVEDVKETKIEKTDEKNQ